MTDCYLKDCAFRAVKRDANFQTWYMEGVSLVSERYTKGERDTFFMKNGIWKVKGWRVGPRGGASPYKQSPPRVHVREPELYLGITLGLLRYFGLFQILFLQEGRKHKSQVTGHKCRSLHCTANNWDKQLTCTLTCTLELWLAVLTCRYFRVICGTLHSSLNWTPFPSKSEIKILL